MPDRCSDYSHRILIEEVGNFREVAVPESANQTKLAQDRQQTLEDARAAKTAGGNAVDSDRLVDDVFLVGIEEVLQQPGGNCDCIPAQQARHRRRGKRARETMIFHGFPASDVQIFNVRISTYSVSTPDCFDVSPKTNAVCSLIWPGRAVPRTMGIKSGPNCAVG